MEAPVHKIEKKPKVRPDTLIIKTSGNKSYRNVLKSLRHNDKALEIGENIKAIKRTKTGDVLMTVKHKAKQKMEDIIKSIEDALENNTSIRQLGNSRLIQISNLDQITSNEEVIDAIQATLGTAAKDTRIIVRDLQVWKDGTQTANILISEPEVIKLLKKK